ncbi:MAG: response regulator transcription factor, partial [Bdellovibrionales bacterium]|nr:response regulator transcription factor [Bdellovibrionales bacterium]
MQINFHNFVPILIMFDSVTLKEEVGMALPRVLLVEDEEAHRLVIRKALHGHCELDVASSFAEGLSQLEK